MTRRVLILTDGKAGHENQSKAFARGISAGFEIAEVHYKSKFHKALSYFFSRIGILPMFLFSGAESWRSKDKKSNGAGKSEDAISAVIGTGSGTFYPVAAIAKRLNVPAGVILYPRGYSLSDFACILAPSFDCPPSKPNIVSVPVNLTATDDAFYEAGSKAFLARYTPSQKPAVAVILGGPNKAADMTADWTKSVLSEVFAMTEGCERWVTTSRRTPSDVEAVVDSFPFDFKLLYSRDHFNPIPAFVAMAQTLYVSAESTGMISEAVTRGRATVEILDNFRPGSSKFRRFVDGLIAEKAARPLGGKNDARKKINLSSAFSIAKHLLFGKGE